MPEISRFFGIVIGMYFDDHDPPHFHANYAGREARFGIDPAEVLSGGLPRRAASLVVEWAGLHRTELMDNWNALHTGGQAEKIPPLE